MKALIVAGGKTDENFAREMILQGGYEFIVAVDSGLNFFYQAGIEPDIVVGDFDSVGADVLDFYRDHEHVEICMLNPEKDDTDTEFSIREAIRRGANKITLMGGTGTRIDHLLGNVSLLGIGLEENVSIELVDPYNRIRMVDQGIEIRKKEQFGNFLSVIPYSDTVTGVTLEGVKYPLTNHTMGGYNSLGISNEIVADTAKISFEKGILLVIESRD
ncbi:MAG: thiamine diphosphokinase [Agathobacter sp.]|nr:thiamine diphosphokinase [Agathobacter sp.]MBQ2283542.1 thiamine diphosphokinase [Agathobacter sp.]